mgnify:CR=1 FL=1
MNLVYAKFIQDKFKLLSVKDKLFAYPQPRPVALKNIFSSFRYSIDKTGNILLK